MRRRAVGLGPRRRHHEDVAVLDPGVELDAVAAELVLQGLDDLGRVLGGGVPAGEVDHDVVDRP